MFRYPEARPRKGFTLTEVLMAMFVMAIGMISLLALFPAAFQQAKWALDTEQVARAAGNAQSMTEMPHMAVTNVGGLSFVGTTSQSVRNDDIYRPATTNKNSSWRLLATNADPLDTSALSTKLGRNTFLMVEVPAGSGNVFWTFNADKSLTIPGSTARVKLPPVFVDPVIASNSAFNSLRPFVTKNPNPAPPSFNVPPGLPFHVGVNTIDDPGMAAAPFGYIAPFNLPILAANTNANFRPPWSIGLPRFTMSQYLIDTGAVIMRMQTECSMGDEINFNTNGQPLITAGQFTRQRRFTWAYLCNWQDYRTPEVCEVTAVMFNSRPDMTGLSLAPAGEANYTGFPPVALAAGIEGAANNFGRCFVKGLTQAAIRLTSPQPINARVGDWILDNTFILPEFDVGNPLVTVPFLDEFFPTQFPGTTLRPGLVGGQFYKIMDISEVRTAGGLFFQTITLDRPAKSDGFSANLLTGVADVITKSVGRMPQR